MTDDIIVFDADVLGGTPRFRGTRVARDVVDENVVDGMAADDLLDSYPTLDRADLVEYLRTFRASVRVADLPTHVIEAIRAWTPPPGGYVLDDLDDDGKMKPR